MATLICDTRARNITRLRDRALARASANAPGWCVTLNLEMVARASRDPGYERLLRCADLLIPDGQPIAWWSRRALRPCKAAERTTGVDIVEAVLSDPAWGRFGVVGGHAPEETIAAYRGAADRCAFVSAGVITEESIDELAAHIARDSPNIVLVALGVPKQDVICRHLQERSVTAGLLVGVGGTFEILAPGANRCPPWLSRLGLEWLFRLTQEPARLWRRYLVEYPRGTLELLRAARLAPAPAHGSLLRRLCAHAEGGCRGMPGREKQ